MGSKPTLRPAPAAMETTTGIEPAWMGQPGWDLGLLPHHSATSSWLPRPRSDRGNLLVNSQAFYQLNYGRMEAPVRIELTPPGPEPGALPLSYGAIWRRGQDSNLQTLLEATA